MADQTVPLPRDAQQIARLLDSVAIVELIAKLNETRWTGRPGYPIRAMVGMALVKSLYVLPTWTRTARLVADHKGLRDVLGCSPSVYACYRFAEKLRQYDDLLGDCIEFVITALRVELPEMLESCPDE